MTASTFSSPPLLCMFFALLTLRPFVPTLGFVLSLRKTTTRTIRPISIIAAASAINGTLPPTLDSPRTKDTTRTQPPPPMDSGTDEIVGDRRTGEEPMKKELDLLGQPVAATVQTILATTLGQSPSNLSVLQACQTCLATFHTEWMSQLATTTATHAATTTSAVSSTRPATAPRIPSSPQQQKQPSTNATLSEDVVLAASLSHTLCTVVQNLLQECAATVAHGNPRHRNQKRRWVLRQALLTTVERVLKTNTGNTEADIRQMSLVLVTGVVALLPFVPTPPQEQQQHPTTTRIDTRRFLASALTHGWEMDNSGTCAPVQSLAKTFLVQLVSTQSSNNNSAVDLHILCMLARTIHWNTCATDAERTLVASVVEQSVYHDNAADIPAALQLAAQLQPWKNDDDPLPHRLIQTAVAHNLWTAAERIALAATPSTNSPLVTLVTAAIEAHMYRLADTYVSHTATAVVVPPTLRLQARYLHVSSTLTKLMRKQAWPIMERQVMRVDAAVQEWGSCPATATTGMVSTAANTVAGAVDDDDDVPLTTFATASTDIRRFCLDQLTAQGHVDGAQRLAAIWGMSCHYSPADLAAILERKRQTYLQWDDPCIATVVQPRQEPPVLIDDPHVLREQFVQLLQGSDAAAAAHRNIIGFDAEWDDEGTGVAVLQLASSRGGVLLLDMVQLPATVAGSVALCETVGALFANGAADKVGFSCGQDIQRLRSTRLFSGQQQHQHGMLQQGVQRVMDLKKSVPGQGLSRCCQKYLGKPLDKAEQCSQWSRRPLTPQQRTYAALDAITCAVIYAQLVENEADAEAEQLF